LSAPINKILLYLPDSINAEAVDIPYKNP